MLTKLSDEILSAASAGSAKGRLGHFAGGFISPIILPSILVSYHPNFLSVTAAILASPLTIPTGFVIGTISAIKNSGSLYTLL